MEALISELNVWAALAGGFAYFLMGWMWYGPLFGNAWMKQKGMEPPRNLRVR